jgi:hypothetical protein
MSSSVPPPGFEPPFGYGAPAPPEPSTAVAEGVPSPYVPRTARVRASRRKLLAGGGVLLALLGVLTFVLFVSGGSTLTDPVAQAATLSAGASGYRVDGTLTASIAGVPLTGSVSGVVDRPDHAASLSMAFDLSGIPEAAQALGSDTMQMQMIMVGGDIYMKLPPALAAKDPSLGGKPWLKLDLAKLTGIPGFSSLMNNSTATDPTQVLSLLRADSDSITNQGHQLVGGVETTHYHVVLNMTRVPPSLPAADRAAFREALSRLGPASGLSAVPADVWVDAHHLVRRIVLELDLGAGTGPRFQETIAEDVGDYGPQPRPTPPPPDQVQDLSNLVGGNGAITPGG